CRGQHRESARQAGFGRRLSISRGPLPRPRCRRRGTRSGRFRRTYRGRPQSSRRSPQYRSASRHRRRRRGTDRRDRPGRRIITPFIAPRLPANRAVADADENATKFPAKDSLTATLARRISGLRTPLPNERRIGLGGPLKMADTPHTAPAVKPANPNFSSGPCAKRPGWTVEALAGALTGRSHRAKIAKARIQQAIDLTRELL